MEDINENNQQKGKSITAFFKKFKQQQQQKDQQQQQSQEKHHTFPNIHITTSSKNNLDNLNLETTNSNNSSSENLSNSGGNSNNNNNNNSNKSFSLSSSPTFLKNSSEETFSHFGSLPPSTSNSPRNSSQFFLNDSQSSKGGSLKVSSSQEFNQLFFNQSGSRKTPPPNLLMNYLKNIQSFGQGGMNTPGSQSPGGTVSSTPRSRSTSIQNSLNSSGVSTSNNSTLSSSSHYPHHHHHSSQGAPPVPLPRSTSVMNLKLQHVTNQGGTIGGSSSNDIILDYEYITNRFLRSKSELTLPSWELNDQYQVTDYTQAINETLVRTLSNQKMTKSSSDEELNQKSSADLESNSSSTTTASNNGASAPVVFNEDGELLSGTYDKVIDHLTDISKFTGTKYVEEFLFTYHHFMKPIDLLAALKAKFMNPLQFVQPNDPENEKECQQITTHVRLRVINVLKKWLEGHSNQFFDPLLYRPFSQFVDLLLIENPKWGKYLKDLISAPEFLVKNIEHSNSSGNLGLGNQNGNLSEDKPQSMRELISLDNLGAISMLLSNSLVLKDRKKKLKTFKNSFLGSEAIDWIQQRFEIEKRDQAKQVLTKLLRAGYFKHHSDKEDDDSNINSNNTTSPTSTSTTTTTTATTSTNNNNNTKEFKDKSTIYYFHLEKDTYPEPIIPKSPTFTLLEVNPVEVARQLTLIEFNYFSKITPKDLSNQAWSKPDAKDKVPNLIALINRSNRVSYWVASEIISYNIKQRVSTLKRFIVIAEILKKLNNWNTFMSVMMGLCLGSIQRLKKTWEALPKAEFETFQQLLTFTSERQNYAAYRRALLSCNYPCLPFIAIYLKDLTFNEENPDFLENGHINFEKMRMIAKVLMEIDRYQSVPYHLKKIDSIEKLLTPKSVLTDKDLYKASSQCEPTQRGLTESQGLKLERKKSFFQIGSSNKK
ncbi:Ras guanine nucleotide exchange factor Q [Tieghemostelium lacteum]|uniref:Ras guanine nucleotide exchange factor Q n=1 Tax=Tieghemostelium lacteum TaxID=361077 RepID=A0A151ZCP8_TIELA|nr:Ras guanine nucleotide exchange factor Q [Tieghemostelium lacteum]|eukprot:KYQ91711.1 Ras guanine nucleotide exchange factor Q [Tieghemostelium lacteum]